MTQPGGRQEPDRAWSQGPAARLLSLPPLHAILTLGIPTMAVMVLGAASGVLATYFVSRLGAEAIAAVSLVFPITLISMTMMGGGVGAGVSAAIAHALGARRLADATSIAEHAFLITLVIALFFTTTLWLFSPIVFAWMGGRDEVLTGATLFARILFGGSLISFSVSTFDSILRGEGNVRVPSICATLSLGLQILFTPICMFSAGMGLAGAAVATLAGQAIGAVPRLRYIFFAGRGTLQPRLLPARIEKGPIRDILRIGVPASLSTLANYLGLMLLTGVVGRYGTHDVAAFGLGTRLDFLIITLAFGIGSAVLTLVGMAAGAGDLRRVQMLLSRALWLVSVMLGSIALLLVWRPLLWIGIFTHEPEVVAVGSSYLRAVGLSYPFVGMSMIASFACQGLGEAVLPLVLVVGRTLVVTAGAIALSSAHAPVGTIFGLMAAGNVASSALLLWRLHATLRRRIGAA